MARHDEGVGEREMAGEPSKTERVYEYVASRHARGLYPPGHKFVIARLGEETGVSQVPVREALRRLEADGIVEYVHQRGFRAVRPEPEELAQLLEAHGAIESIVVSLAVPRLRASDIAALRGENDRLAAAVAADDGDDFAAASLAFHRILVQRCPNRYLLSALENQAMKAAAMRAAAVVLTPERAADVVAEHAALLTAIDGGASAEEIERMLRAHRQSNVVAYRASLTEPSSSGPDETDAGERTDPAAAREADEAQR
ncbi:MAG: GntR family transcriptional regulator [Mycetocola sp.]